MLTKQRIQMLKEMGKLLLVWSNEEELIGDNISEAHV